MKVVENAIIVPIFTMIIIALISVGIYMHDRIIIRNMVSQISIEYEKESDITARKVKDGGYLATCSCSHFMDPELFTKTIGEAARNVHKRLRQIEYRTQSPDHPILWSADESLYLKFYIFQVVDEK